MLEEPKMKRKLLVLGVLVGAGLSAAALADGLESARSMIAAGRFAEALEALETASGEDPEAGFLRGVALAGAQRLDEAEDVFRDLIREHPEMPEAYNNLAVVQAETGRYDEAAETLKDALRTSEAHRTAWENLTTVYGKLASDAYNRALNLGSPPGREPVRLVLLESMETSGQAAGPEPASGTVIASVGSPGTGEVAADRSPDPTPPAAAEKPVQERPVEPLASSAGPVEPLVMPAATEEVEPAAQPTPESEGPSAEEEASEAAAPEATAEEAETPAPSATELVQFVESWAAAWSAQKVDDYLSFYASGFTPPGGVSRGEWEETRRSRLTAPEYIAVSAAVLDFELGEDTGSVTFNQSYESNTFSDVVTKRLELVREDGEWRIMEEVVTP
jgi:tetratricopeptide (TPR) repeat protein